jgi:hypothetical protein
MVLPVPGAGMMAGSDRYGGGERAGGKPSHEFMCYGFNTFAEAPTPVGIYPRVGRCAEQKARHQQVGRKLIPRARRRRSSTTVSFGIWPPRRINRLGYEGKIGIQIDVAAGTYWEPDKQGLWPVLRRGQDF